MKNDPSSLSINAAIRAAVLSQLAYGESPMPSGDYQMVDMMPTADVQCMVVREADRITFVFRGTKDHRQLLSDANVIFHDIGGGLKVHAGAWRLLDSIWPTLENIASETLIDRLPIYVEGHSLGGMLACLFSLRVARERNIKVAPSTTFGEPRSLNQKAADYFNNLGLVRWRFVDEADLVTRVPWCFGLYQHVGRSCFIDKWGQITFDEPWYAHLLSDAVEIIQEALRRENAPIYDHGIQRYIDALTTYRLQITA
jgi:hypothetical protein